MPTQLDRIEGKLDMLIGLHGSSLCTTKPPTTSVESDPYFASVKSLLHFDGNLTDVKGVTWTNNGTSANGAAKFGTNSLLIPAATRLTTTNSTLRGTTLTVEGWVKFTNAFDDYVFVSEGGSWSWSGTNGIEFFLATDRVNGRLSLPYQIGGNYNQIFSRNSSIAQDVWYHIAVVFNAAGSQKAQLFINGVLEATSATGLTQLSSWATFSIGDSTQVTNNGNCLVDEFRLTTVARYVGVNVGDTVFTPPTKAFPDQ